jgi:hypothetical protein
LLPQAAGKTCFIAAFAGLKNGAQSVTLLMT